MKQLVFGVIVLATLVVIGLAVFSQSDDTPTVNDTQTTPTETSTDEDSQPAAEQTFTIEEVATHASEDDCWTVISGNVYDITSFISSHPGGDEILRACGADATTLFTSRTTEEGEQVGSGTPHSSNAAAQLAELQIGVLAQ